MSRSATNCYETVMMMSQEGIGQSTCVGIGGDMIPGSTFIDLLPDFEEDEETEAIVMIGEIGGSEEELAAEYIKKYVTKPVIALIAGCLLYTSSPGFKEPFLISSRSWSMISSYSLVFFNGSSLSLIHI